MDEEELASTTDDSGAVGLDEEGVNEDELASATLHRFFLADLIPGLMSVVRRQPILVGRGPPFLPINLHATDSTDHDSTTAATNTVGDLSERTNQTQACSSSTGPWPTPTCMQSSTRSRVASTLYGKCRYHLHRENGCGLCFWGSRDFPSVYCYSGSLSHSRSASRSRLEMIAKHPHCSASLGQLSLQIF